MKRFVSLILVIALVVSTVPNITIAAPVGAGLYPLTERDANDIAQRYTVLILDISGSMAGTPMTVMKEAAKKFVEAVLDTTGENYVALITYDSYVYTRSRFIADDEAETLNQIIRGLSAGSNTNTGGALQSAGVLLREIENGDGIIKNIVIMSDGESNTGPNAISTANSLKNEGIFIYSLGFFHSSSSGRSEMQSIQNAGYYDVVDPNELAFTFGQIANTILRITGDFHYGSPVKGADGNVRDYSDTFYYDDRYFAESAYRPYNIHLASMSLCFELSAWGSNDEGREVNGRNRDDYTNKSVNTQELLKKIGYSGIAVDNWFRQKPEMDSIGVVAGCKDIKFGETEYTIIAVAVRGGGYEAEWASNFTLGRNGDHTGFSEARDNVLSFLSEYVSYYDISGNVKIWLTGYSRAGATANLVGASLVDGFSLGNGVVLDPEDLFVYTFEAPKGTINPNAGNPKYNNIKNRVNIDDMVPYVAMERYGFRRYGMDSYNPDAATYASYLTLENNMLSHYKNLNAINSDAGKYTVPDFTRYTVSVEWALFVPYVEINKQFRGSASGAHLQGVFLDDTLERFARDVLFSRQMYTTLNEPGIRLLLGGLTSGAMNYFIEKLQKNALGIIVDYLAAEIIPFGKTGEEVLVEKLVTYLNDSLREAGVTTLNIRDVTSIALTVAQLIGGMIAAQLVDEVATLILNLDCIANAHYPELCFAWLKSKDGYYNGEFNDDPLDPDSREDGFYRIVRINCPVNVEVFGCSGELVTAIIDNIPLDIEGSSIMADYTSNGEKIIYLPPDESYELKITATGDDKMMYAINERSAGNAYASRIVVFSELDIETGDVFIGKVPAFGSGDYLLGLVGTNAVYQLEGHDGDTLSPTIDIKGDEVSDALYTVTAKASDPNLGYITGSCTVFPGQYATVNVVPRSETPFEGWYEGNQLVSTDFEYRLTTTRDIELIARFKTTNKSSSTRSTTITENPVPESDFPLLDKSGATGYISGYPDGTFGGTRNITRYETAVLFYSLIIDSNKENYASEVSKFSDMTDNQWYSEAVGYLTAKGILLGYPDGLFKGNNPITRAEFATIASRLNIINDIGDIPFTDVPNEHWAIGYITNAYKNGWISGYPDGTFMPNKNISRAEAVTITNKMLGWTGDADREFIVTFSDVSKGDWYITEVLLAANGLE